MAKTENVQSKVIRVSPVESLGKQIYTYIHTYILNKNTTGR